MRNGIKIPRFVFFLSIIFVLLDTAVPEFPGGLKLTWGADTNPELRLDSEILIGMNGATGIPVTTYEYRYPQVPLDVDGYPIGPEGLELEQVHVYVRHGACLPVMQSYPTLLFGFRRTHPSWCSIEWATRMDTGILEHVQNCWTVP